MPDNPDSLGPVSVEWVIDNQQIFADLAKTQEGFAQTAAAADKTKAALSNINDGGAIAEVNADIDKQKGLIAALQEQLKALKASYADIADVNQLAAVNAQMDDITAKIKELKALRPESPATAAPAPAQVENIPVFSEPMVTDVSSLTAYEEMLAKLNRLLADNTISQEEYNAALKEAQGLDLSVAASMETLGTAAAAVTEKQISYIDQLKANLTSLRAQAAAIADPLDPALVKINQGIQETQGEIARFGNIGLSGFDELGNKLPVVEEKTSAFNKALNNLTNLGNLGAQAIQRFGRQLVGLGTGFLVFTVLQKGIEWLAQWISGLDVFTGRLNQAKQNMSAFNEVMANADKAAGQQIATFQLLYKAATDVNKSMSDRLQAAKQLKDLYPAELSNTSALTIANGGLASSYDEIAKSIQKVAESQAAVKKIGDLETTILDAQLKKQQINADLQKTLASPDANLTAPSIAGGRGGLANSGVQKTNAQIAQENAAKLNQEQDQNIKIAQGQINFLAQFVGSVTKAGQQLADANKILGDNLQNFNDVLAKAGDKQQLENIKSALQAKLDALTPGDAQISVIKSKLKQVDDLISGSYGVKGTANNLYDPLSSRLKLLTEIEASLKNVDSKQLDTDQAQLMAVENRFDLLRKKISDFNTDPRNAGHQIGTADISKINQQEVTAEDNQANLNENAYIKKDIQQKEQLYADYQAYRQKVGNQIAAQDYADLLRSGKSFEDYLSNIMASIPKGDTSGPMQQRRQLVLDYQQKDKEQQQKYLEGLQQQLQNYQTKRLVLTETYEADYAALKKAGRTQEAADLTEQYQLQLKQLDDSNFQQLESVKELFSGISDMSTKSAKALIADVQAELNARIAAGTISEAEAKKAQQSLDNASLSVADRLPKSMQSAASALGQMANEVQTLNQGLSDTLGLLSNIVGNIGTAISSINDYEKAKKNNDTGGQITAGLGIVSSVISIGSGIINFFKAAKQSAIQAAAELKQYQDSLITGQMQYNQLLREQADTMANINSMSAAQLQQQEQTLQSSMSGAQSDYNTLLQQIDSQGQQITGEHTQKYGGFLGIGRKTKVVQDTAGLSGANYDQLLKLFNENKLTDATKSWFEQLQKVHDEMGTISADESQVEDQLNQMFTGTTASDLGNAILQGLEQGKRGFAAFADDFQSAMQQALDSTFLNTELDPAIQQFYTDFAKAARSAGGLTPEAIAKLQGEYQTLINNAGSEYQQLYKITGITTPSASGNATGLSGQISGVSETTANALEGILQGVQLAAIQSNDYLKANSGTMADQLAELKNQTLTQMAIAANTKRTADNSDKMTASLSSIDKKMSSNYNALTANGL